MAAARFPLTTAELADFTTAVETHILPGYTPDRPFLPRTAGVATIGSCFAEHIGKTLTGLGIPAAWVAVDENNNTPFVTDLAFSKLRDRANGPERHKIEQLLNSSLVIITVGVALQRFVEGHPAAAGKDSYKGGDWRMFTVDELTTYLRSIVAKARALLPGAHLVLTLSPIPLKGSPAHASVFGQDCLSKSLMRVAIEQVLNDRTPDLTYWPSFEIIRWLGGHVGPFFGGEGTEDQRHVKKPILDAIMRLFISRYFLDAPSP